MSDFEYEDFLSHPFQVAFSFSGKYRGLVKQVADELTERLGDSSVFYDFYYNPHLARPNLNLVLQKIYKNNCKLIVVFLSTDYNEKEWCGVEFRVILDLIKKQEDEKIMLLKVDDVNIEDIAGLFSTDGYLDIRDMAPIKVVDSIIERLQGIRVDRKKNEYEFLIDMRGTSAQPAAEEENAMGLKRRILRPDPTRSILDITRYTMRLR